MNKLGKICISEEDIEITRILPKNITIIGRGNLGEYLYGRFSNDFNCEKISAGDLDKSINSVIDSVEEIIGVGDIIKKLQDGEYVFYTGKGGNLLDFIIKSINECCYDKIKNFYVFGTNGAIDYGLRVPRLVLNSAIKEDQLPVSFGKTIFYHPNPSDFEKLFIERLNFDVSLTKDINIFYKEFYLKLCVNIIFNSICIIYNEPTLCAFNKYEKENKNGVKDIVLELYEILNIIIPGILPKLKILDHIHHVKNTISDIYPSSVAQFYNNEDNSKSKYDNSEIGIMVGWIIDYAKENNIEVKKICLLNSKIEEISKKGFGTGK